MPVVVYELKGEEKDLVAALKTVTTEMGKTTVAAKRLDKAKDEATKSSNRLKSGLEGLKQAGTGAQGTIGSLTGQIENWTRSVLEIGSALGPAGAAVATFTLAAAGVGIGVVAGANAIISMVESARELVDELDSRVSPGTEVAASRIEQFGLQMDGARVQGDRLKVLLAGELASAFRELPILLTQMAVALEPVINLIGFMREQVDAASGLIRAWSALLSLGATEIIRNVAIPAFQSLIPELNKTARALGEVNEELEDIEFDEPVRKVEDLRKANAEAARAAKDLARAEESLARILQDATFALLDPQQRLIELADRRLEQIDELEAKTGLVAEAEAARRAVLEELNQELAELNENTQLAIIGSDEWNEKLQEAGQGAAELQQQVDDFAGNSLPLIADGLLKTAGIVAQTTGSIVGAIQSFVDEGSKAYKALEVVSKAAALTEIVVQTARGIMMALGTIPPPLGQVVAAGIAAEGVRQSAAVIKAGSGGGGGGGGVEQPGNGGTPGGINRGLPGTSSSGTEGNTFAPLPGAPVFITFRSQLLEASVPTMSVTPGSIIRDLKKNGARSGHSQRSTPPRKLTT